MTSKKDHSSINLSPPRGKEFLNTAPDAGQLEDVPQSLNLAYMEDDESNGVIMPSLQKSSELSASPTIIRRNKGQK